MKEIILFFLFFYFKQFYIFYSAVFLLINLLPSSGNDTIQSQGHPLYFFA